MAYAPGYGQNTDVDAAAEALAASTRVKVGVRIKALAANTTGVIYVGNSLAVTAVNGFPLAAGEAESFDVAWFGGNLANIYVIGSTTNLAVAYWWV